MKKITLLIFFIIIFSKNVFSQSDSILSKIRDYQVKFNKENSDYKNIKLIDSIILLDSTNFKYYNTKVQLLKKLKLYKSIIKNYEKALNLEIRSKNIIFLKKCFFDLYEVYWFLNNQEMSQKYYNLYLTFKIINPIPIIYE